MSVTSSCAGGRAAFDEFRGGPAGTGIVHQVNIEHLARVVMVRNGQAYPDTCVGTDSHTTMVNGLGVLGWGVGGIEAEAAMLRPAGQHVDPEWSSVSSSRARCPRRDRHRPGAHDHRDVAPARRRRQVREFYGEGVAAVPLANRATIGNMSPEYGSTVAIFPIDDETLAYLRLTGRSDQQIAVVEVVRRRRVCGTTRAGSLPTPEYLELDLADVVPSLAGPKRPQDRVGPRRGRHLVRRGAADLHGEPDPSQTATLRWRDRRSPSTRCRGHRRHHQSCTNTSNPRSCSVRHCWPRRRSRPG